VQHPITTAVGWGPVPLHCACMLGTSADHTSRPKLLPDFVFCCCRNHEATFCTKHYGFHNELLAKYGKAGKVRAKQVSADCGLCKELAGA
jgi:hypothetical protein